MKIFYFVSGHGFGHISRSFEIIKELINYNFHIILFTERIDFLRNFNHPNLTLIELGTDIGIIQNSSIDMDLNATKNAILTLEKNKKTISNKLSSLIDLHKPNFLISDISSFPFTIAKKYNIPSVFIGNFTWDFIYANYSKYDSFFEEISDQLKMEYGLSDRGFELPFSCPISSVPNLKKIGLIGRYPTLSRDEARKKLNFEESQNYILLSFGAYGLDCNKFMFENLDENLFLVVSGLRDFDGKNVIHIDDFYYPDILMACDAVLTKPGYGILSEAYTTNCPIIYTDRGDFLEYSYLVEAMKTYHNSIYISQDELFSLNLRDTLTLLQKTFKKTIPKLENGVAEILKTFLN